MKSSFYREVETKNKLAEFILKTDILSMNEQCKRFELDFAKKQERKFAVFVNSGSSANLILIQSFLNLGLLKKGDKVGVSSLTWPTNMMPLIQLGLVPVLLDCELDTLNISPEILSPYLKDIKGLFITNVLGFCDQLDVIQSLCKENNVLLFEDNCESLGSKFKNKLLGNFGIASTFSFFVGHHLSTIEGGMVCTDDEDLYDMLVMVRAHGWDRNLSSEKQKVLRDKNMIDDFYSRYTFYDLSYNFRPTEINGFLGNEQLKYWNEIVEKREQNFKNFQKVICDNDDLLILNFDHMDVVSNFSMPVICKNKEIFNKYKERFESKVEIRPVIAGAMNKQPFFKKYIDIEQTKCSNAEFVHDCGFYFGNNPELTEEDFDTIFSLLKK